MQVSSLKKILNFYHYNYPKSLIAAMPASPRDSAKLLVYDKKTDKRKLDTFRSLAKHIPKNAVLVFNQTKVIPARLTVMKDTGGKVELLYTGVTSQGILVLANRKLISGLVLHLSNKYSFVVNKSFGSEYELLPQFLKPSIQYVMEKFGSMPLPPYLRHSPLSEAKRRKEYQTIFGKIPGAVAAPTASLHFTKQLIRDLKKKEIKTAFVTLHVGLGTFAPLTEEALKRKKLHHEYYEIDAKTAKDLNKWKKEGRPIIAVGTTVVRTLESASNSLSHLVKLKGSTDLFITENYKLKFVNQLITNFHVPSSSLLMLVAAFIGRRKLLEIYKFAIGKKFRLFSFGDGMYIK